MRSLPRVAAASVALGALAYGAGAGCTTTRDRRPATSTPTPTQTGTNTRTPTRTPSPTPSPNVYCTDFETGAWPPGWTDGFAAGNVDCTGSVSWCQDMGGGSRSFSTTYAQSGTYSLLLGDDTGAGGGDVDWASFPITVPSAGAPALTFWWRHFASDYPPFDWFRVEILDAACTTLLAAVLCDLPPASTPCGGVGYDSGWQSASFPLTAYMGQPVTIWFGSYEDGACAPSFTHIDDVCVQ